MLQNYVDILNTWTKSGLTLLGHRRISKSDLHTTYPVGFTETMIVTTASRSSERCTCLAASTERGYSCYRFTSQQAGGVALRPLWQCTSAMWRCFSSPHRGHVFKRFLSIIRLHGVFRAFFGREVGVNIPSKFRQNLFRYVSYRAVRK